MARIRFTMVVTNEPKQSEPKEGPNAFFVALIVVPLKSETVSERYHLVTTPPVMYVRISTQRE